MAYLARVSYTGNNSTVDYSIPFSYIVSSHIYAWLDNSATTAFSVSGSTLTFDTAPGTGVAILIKRVTPTDARLVDFTDGSVLTESDLDQSADQNFYIAQESSDEAQLHLSLDNSNKYDAESKQIINVADPSANQHAVTKYYLENTWLSTSDKANITTLAGISGLATLAGITSDVTAVAADATDIGIVSTNIASVNTVAGISANVTTVAGIDSDVTAVAGDATDIGAVAAKATEIGRLGTADAVADLALLGTSAVVTDLDLLATAGNVTAMGLLGNSTTVANMALLGTADAVSDMNTLATAPIVADLAMLADTDIVADLAQLATTDFVADLNAIEAVKANVTTCADNLTGINNFADTYSVGSSNPTGGTVTAGDIFFNTTDSQFKYYNGSSWASVTAGIGSMADDTTPQLGGDLDLNSFDIPASESVKGFSIAMAICL